MSRYTRGMFEREFSEKDGYRYLATSIIESTILDWKKGKFDIVGWLESNQSYLWFDYLGLDREWLKRLIEGMEVA